MNDKNMTGEIVVYQPDEITRLEVRVESETVWLNRHQLAELFVRNIPTVANFATVQKEGNRFVERKVEYYNLDMIISVGYRVKSERGVLFRQWANSVLKEYMLRRDVANKRIEVVENILLDHSHRLDEHQKQIDFFVRTSLPPVEGIFFDGQIFDAYVFVSDLIKSARRSLVLIDNYVDESVLMLLSKRSSSVTAEIRTGHLSGQLQLDVRKHNGQYPPINIVQAPNIHDRFLIVDDDVYHIGASLKDLGKKLFAFSRLGLSPTMLL